MITITRSKRFNTEYKKFVKNNTPRAESIIKAVEKLKGSNIWTIRLSEGNRLFFLWINEFVILLVDVGSHDKYKHY